MNSSSPHSIATIRGYALRTYAISLGFSLGPSLLPILLDRLRSGSRNPRLSLCKVLQREFAIDGFAATLTLAVSSGTVLQQFWTAFSAKPGVPRLARALNSTQRAYVANFVSSLLAYELIQSGRRRARNSNSSPSGRHTTSPTLQLTLLLLVRAADVGTQLLIQRMLTKRDQLKTMGDVEVSDVHKRAQVQARLTTAIDGIVFWFSSARIMWCFFYEPQRLPPTYVKWISNLANLDGRIVEALRLLRSGEWSYIKGSIQHRSILSHYAQALGYPKSWADPVDLPAYGGIPANRIWRSLGVTSRGGVGGLPCEIVHGNMKTSSCTVNARDRAIIAFIKAILLYLPVHFLPVILTRPLSLLQPRRFMFKLLAAVRSATFLSTFVASFWYTVCLTRTLVLARLFPLVSHDFWDGPLGCVFAGSLVCGTSINIEHPRRRGEIALFVLPKAVLASLPRTLTHRLSASATERIVFALSLSSLLTAALHRPESLRGLSRWVLAFIFAPSALTTSERIKNTPHNQPEDASHSANSSSEYT